MIESIDLNGVAISTKNIVHDGVTILEAYHDEDGIWQFLDASRVLDENDSVVVSLGTMLNIDSTLKDVFNLTLGSKACRKDKNSNWVRKPL